MLNAPPSNTLQEHNTSFLVCAINEKPKLITRIISAAD